MKKCTSCGIEKSLIEFQKRLSAKDGHTNLCKPCKREYDNNHYKNNAHRKDYIKANREKSLKSAEEYILEYLLKNPCIDCGEPDPIVLEFDHIDPSIKDGVISVLKRSSLSKVKKEIEKCEVRCANCHRRKTAKQFGWKNKLPL